MKNQPLEKIPYSFTNATSQTSCTPFLMGSAGLICLDHFADSLNVKGAETMVRSTPRHYYSGDSHDAPDHYTFSLRPFPVKHLREGADCLPGTAAIPTTAHGSRA